MSSHSRRSSFSRSSVTSIRPPAWQAVSKKSAPASVSLISAEPQLPHPQSSSTRSTGASTSKLKKIHKKASLLASSREVPEISRATNDTPSIPQESEPIVSGRTNEPETLNDSNTSALDVPAIVPQAIPDASPRSTIPELLPSSGLISDAMDSSVVPIQPKTQSSDNSTKLGSGKDAVPELPAASAPSPEPMVTLPSHGPDDSSPSTSVQPAASCEGVGSENNTNEQVTETTSWFPSFSFAFSKSSEKPADPPSPPLAPTEPLPSAPKEENTSSSDAQAQPTAGATSSTSSSTNILVPVPASKEESHDPSPPKPPPLSQTPPRRGWFSSSSPTNPSPLKRQVTLNVQSEVSSISIDEEVPGLATSPSLTTLLTAPEPSLVPSDSSESSPGQTRTLSTLNPSQSRFMLNIPLLGKSKIPLSQAVGETSTMTQEASGAAEQTESQHDETNSVLHHMVASETNIPPSQVTVVPVEADDGPSSQQENITPVSMDVNKTSNVVSSSSSSSWWDYIGWQNAAASTASPPSDDHQTNELTTPEENHESAHPIASNLQTDVTAADNQTDDVTPKPSEKPMSTISSQSQSGGSWFAPWTWYNGSPEPSVINEQGMTEAEQVKEYALKRSDPDPPEQEQLSSASPPPQTPSPRPRETNPIESISANKGWASFFASTGRSLLIKNITSGPQEEPGMEVMDISDDEGAPTSTATAEAVVKKEDEIRQRGRKIESGKQISGSNIDMSDKPSAPPLTNSESVKRKTNKAEAASKAKTTSPAPPKKPNLVLPTWGDTFHAPPRSVLPPEPESRLKETFRLVKGALFNKDDEGKGKLKTRDSEFVHFGKTLPRAWDVIEQTSDVLRGASKAVVIGVHGWFPGAMMRSVLGEPTGTSTKFVTMMMQALEEFQVKHHVKLEKITAIPLEGEGTIDKRVEKLYDALTSNKDWMADLYDADVIFIATHSQGSIVSTHLLDRLIRDKHIQPPRSEPSFSIDPSTMDTVNVVSTGKLQRICCLAQCGIHLGPLRYLNSSSLIQPYIQYFENAAAQELFEFQDTESKVSKAYVKALSNILYHGVKMVYVASLNDQVVPVYSGLFTMASHPLILRALYIDGDVYHSSDFLSNLLVLLIRVFNAGLSDSGLVTHLSEATAGSLNGVGHSTSYEERATYSLAVNYLFLTNEGLDAHPELVLEPFNARTEQNDYEIPWSLRDLIADPHVQYFFSREIHELKDAFSKWQPKTTILRDIKRKLQPIQKLPSTTNAATSTTPLQAKTNSVSKL